MENFYFTPCLILSFCLAVFINQSNAEYDNCYDDENNVLLACNPPSYDVMWNNVAKIKVEPTTATCGIPASKFRRLATRMTTISETCDAAIPQFQHNPEFMIDDNTTSTWWQSTNLSPGSEEMNINITVSFNKTFRMDSDLVITFNSGRPDKMIVMKSADFGVTWTPLQYYAKNCDDFQSVVVPGAAITVDTPTAITCTSEYVEQTPRAVANRTVVLVNQERFDLFLGPIGINFSAFYEAMEQKLMNFLTFTDIRIQLIKPLTDDRGLYDAYYYAISDIQLVSRCWCNLHASFCNYGADGFYCDCQHNTTGKNCEMCQPLFNERQWQKGSYIPYPKGQANECIKCECNNHALSCTFNATYGRGICDTCLHNTEGYHCELCAPTYFPNVSLALNDINRCIECKCEPLGVLDNNLTCAQTEKTSVSIGQCNCKPLVTSLRCNTCVTGYYGLLTGPTPGSCTACNCNQMGTVGGSINCTQDGGQCSCKQSITGRTCDICKDMYYSFPANNPQGECSACGCDKGGSLLSVCDKVSGQCTCRTNITGDKCTEALPGTYVPAVDILLYQPVPGACNVTSDLYTDQAPFDGGKFAVCDVSSRNVTLEFDTIKGGQLQKDLQWPYILVVRYSTNNSWVSGTVKLQAIGSTSADLSPLATKLGQQNVTFQCPYNGLTGQVEMMFKPGISSAVLSQTHNLTLDARCTYSLTLQLFSSNSNQSVGNITDSAIEIDSLVLLPTLSSTDGSTSFNFYDASDNKIVLKDKYLSCLQQLSDLKMRQITLLTSPCREILFSVGAELFNGSKACDCLSISSVSSLTCQELGGQCQCKPGVYGRACDICKPGYFNFSENGCSRCPVLPCAIEVIFAHTTTAIPTTQTSISTKNITVIDNSDSSGLSAGYIALIVICAALFICFIVFLIWWMCKRHRKKQKTIEHGLYSMTHFGLGDSNSPLYSNNIYEQQSHWIDGSGNENRAATAILNGDIESDSVFEAHSDVSAFSFDRPKFYIASDENTSSLDKKKKTKLWLYTVSKKEKSTPYNQDSHHHQMNYMNRNKSYESLNVDFRPALNSGVSSSKPRTRSENTNAKESNNTFSYGLNHWRPLYDLRETESVNRLSPSLSPNFYPYHGHKKHDNKMKNPLQLIEKPLKKSPQKPARKKKPKRHSSLLDKILPPPLMYSGNSPTFIPDPDYDTMSESKVFIPKPDYSLFDGYDNPAFIPKPDYPFFGRYDNPVFIPKPDYSFIEGYDNPVFIPEPDYPCYAVYGYFDEVNACNCHPKGAETGYCNITSGICQCKPNILSLKDNANITLISEMNIKIDGTCGRCLPNYYGIDSGKGCVPCYCSVNGSTDQQCDETGQCPCKDTVTGLKCNICKDGYYDFGSNGCSPCNCSTSGSTQLTCHQLTGTCTCKSNVEGTKCSLCKTGFFNLASYNLDGCQPCFCYNHSMNCTSAVGYQSKLLQVANPATPGDYEIFLGDRHWSYGQSLTVKFSVIKEIDLTGEILVSLTGAGKSLHFVAPNGTGFNSNRFLTISTRLLEQNWMMEKNETTVKPHAQEMLDILANLTAISTITKAKDQQITTVYLGLEWAENNKSVESIGVNFVENCICAETSNTAGLSCEKCSRGYMREDLVHFSSFSNCVACNCSRRGITDPPECDELTGICVNCRNGTTGNHCEKCSPHVVEPECVTCESTYWGLQANGCRECNCSEPGAKSNYCNPVSGQCTCAANVIGRTCDQCQENFYNISINGCIECDSCYATLSVAILPLRQLELEISSNITFLKVSDITSINGAFMTHYLEATKQTKQLNDFLTSIQQSEADIKNSIQEFNITISSFETEIETIQNNKTIDIERLLSSSESVIKMALSYRSILEDNIVFIYNKLASLQGSQSSLANLANSLKTVEQHLVSIANSSFSDQQILINLSTLNNTLFLTNQLVNDAQQKADVASQIHKNNTSALLALDTRISTLSNEADKVLSNAKSLGANDILAAATKLRTQLSQFVSFKLDNSNLVDKLVKMRGEVTSLQTLLTAEVSFFNTTNVNALATVPRADELSNQSRIIGFSSSEWMARSNTAAQRAASFQSQASTMLQDANKTLWTLNNFKVRVGDALQQVDALNLKVSPTLTLSEQLIQQSQNLTQTLALLQQTASAAKEYSQQALIMISLRQKEFQTVTAESSQLQTRLNDIADLSIERFRALNNTKFYVVQPGALQCSALNSSVLDYQDQLSSTQKVVATSLVQIANLTQRANDIIGQLHSLNKIDSASISVLFSNIQSAQNVLNVDNLKLTISNLLIQKNVQRKKIDNLKLMRDNLKSKIQSLKAFQNQIIST